MINPTSADLIAEYIWLRDHKEAEEERFKEFLYENYIERMNEIERDLMLTLNRLGTDSMTAHGVGNAHKKLKSSVTIGDPKIFRSYVIAGARWELVDWRANKTMVGDLVAHNQPVPPGVNYSAVYKLGIRKG